jgi:hypothetical protein
MESARKAAKLRQECDVALATEARNTSVGNVVFGSNVDAVMRGWTPKDDKTFCYGDFIAETDEDLVEMQLLEYHTIIPFEDTYNEDMDKVDGFALMTANANTFALGEQNSVLVGLPNIILGLWKENHVSRSIGGAFPMHLHQPGQSLVIPEDDKLQKKCAGSYTAQLQGLVSIKKQMKAKKMTHVRVPLWLPEDTSQVVKITWSQGFIEKQISEMAIMAVSIRARFRDDEGALRGALTNAADAYEMLGNNDAKKFREWVSHIEKSEKGQIYRLHVPGVIAEDTLTFKRVLDMMKKESLTGEDIRDLKIHLAEGKIKVSDPETILKTYLSMEPKNGLSLSEIKVTGKV